MMSLLNLACYLMLLFVNELLATKANFDVKIALNWCVSLIIKTYKFKTYYYTIKTTNMSKFIRVAKFFINFWFSKRNR